MNANYSHKRNRIFTFPPHGSRPNSIRHRALALVRELFRHFCEWILASTQFNPQWSAYQRECIAEMLLEIAFVGVTDRFQSIAMDHDDRRILTALVCIA